MRYSEQFSEEDDYSLYIIQSGEVEVMAYQGDKLDKVYTLKQQEYFGIFELFMQKPSSKLIQVTSSNFTIAYKLEYKDFISILKQFPSDLHKYCMIRD